MLSEFYKLYDKREYQKALVIASQLDSATIPIDARKDYWQKLAWAYKQLGDYPSALKHYRDLCEHYPEALVGYEGVAQVLTQQQCYGDAISAWQVVADKFTASPLPYWSIGNIYRDKLSNYPAAVAAFQQQISHHPMRSSGYEGLAKTYEQSQEYVQALATWQLISKKFPSVTLAYWSMGNIYRDHLADFEQAIQAFKQQIARFPTRLSGYQGLAETLPAAKHYDGALLAWQAVTDKFPDESKPYWAMGHIYQARKEYGQAETKFRQLINKFPQRESGYEALAKLAQVQQQWLQAARHWQRYYQQFPQHYEAFTHYLDNIIKADELANLDVEPLLATAAQQAKLTQYQVRSKYLELLRKNCHYDSLACTAKRYLDEQPQQRYHEMYFIGLYCQQKYVEAKWAYLVLLSQFNPTISELTYTYLDTLYHLYQHDLMQMHYVEMVKKSYPQIAQYFPSYDYTPEKVAIAETLGDFATADKLRAQYQPPTERPTIVKPKFDPGVECEYIHHSDDNQTLMIFFSGLTFKLQANFEQYGLSNLEGIKEDNQGIKSSFIRFAERTKSYNMLMINDIYTSWELMHQKEYLAYIQQIIETSQPKTVVCVGISSGGYAAMLYGELLKANLVFAFAPQTLPYFNYANHLAHLHKIQFDLGLDSQLSIIRLQNTQGFYAKTYLLVSEKNGMDNLGLNSLNKADPNLAIIYCQGDAHVPIQTLGVKHVYTEMCRLTDIMQDSANTSGILPDAFAHLAGYQHSSYLTSANNT